MKRSFAPSGFVIFVAILMMLGACAAPAKSVAERPALASSLPTPEIVQLPNGLKVALYPDKAAPLTSIQYWVNGGAADETPEIDGIFHLYEHMSFKGTKKYGVGEIARAVSAAGGDINAYTSFDHTVYYVNMPREGFGIGLDVLSDAVLNSIFDPTELAREKEVVVEEIRRSLDNPQRVVGWDIFSTVFSAHPYGRRVLGTEETVRSISREKIVEVYHQYYIPSNMTLVIVGDFDSEKALGRVREIFADVPAGTPPQVNRPAEPEQTAPRFSVKPLKTERAYIEIGFPIPGLIDPDVPALDILASAAGRGRTSPLYQALRVRRRLADSVSAYSYTPEDPGIFGVDAVVDPENIEAAIEEILAVIYRLDREAPAAEDIEAAKLSIEADALYSLEQYNSLAREFGYFYTHHGNLNYRRIYLDALVGIDEGSLKKAAKKYLVPEKLNISIVAPEAVAENISIDKLRAIAEKAAAAADEEPPNEWRAVSTVSESAGAAPVERMELANGVRVILRHNPDSPTVAFDLFFEGGKTSETPETEGVSSIASSLLYKGAGSYDADGFSREVNSIAARGVGGDSADHYVSVSGLFLKQFVGRGVELLAMMISEPRFDGVELDRIKKDYLAAIERRKDNPVQMVFRQFSKEMYPDHPYGYDSLSTPEVLENLTPEDVAAWWKNQAVKKRMVVSVSGAIDRDRVLALLKENFAELPAEGESAAAPAPPVPAKEVKVAEIFNDGAQSHLAIGLPGADFEDQDRFALSTGIETLANMGGRLFVNLRDRQSLAYSVFASARTKVWGGYVLGYIACAPDKLQQAIDGMKAEFNKISAEGISEEELAEAKASLIGGFQMSLSDNADWAGALGSYEISGLGFDYYLKLPENFRKVTVEDVGAAAEKYLDFGRATYSVVRPEGTPAEVKY